MSKIRLLGRWLFDQFLLPLWEALASDPLPEKEEPGDGPASSDT